MARVYATPDDCESELGKRMQYWRAERPSEWMMDEFIQEVESMHKQIKRLEGMVEHGLGPEDMEQDV